MTPRSIAIARTSGGTCTFHEYTARCPNRAPTVRAHNWVVLGALLDNPGQPPVPAPVGTALLPEIPVASSIPGLRSHRSFPDQM